MKTQVCLPKILLLTVALGIAGPWMVAATTTPTTSRPGTKAVATPPPAAPAPEPTIPGFVIPRTSGGYLSLQVVEGKFMLRFFGADKKPVPVNVARAAVRWIVHYSVLNERTVLNPNGDNTALTSPKFVRPPYLFKLYLTLLGPEGEESVEDYVIDFRQ
jgi:hypothetical protein